MPAGRPRAFATVEELQTGIDEYIEKATEEERPLNIDSLAVHLGVDRRTIFRYEAGDYGEEYCHPIKRVVQICGAQTVEGLLSGKKSAAGCIFVLCNNHGYQNKQFIKEDSTRRTEPTAEPKTREEIVNDVLERLKTAH